MTRRSEEFDLLDKLRQTGPLPHPLEERHQHLRRQQFFSAGLKCERYPPSTSSRLNPDMAVADWVRARWSSADEAVRHSLRLLADALGIPLPLRRTRPIGGKDSSPTRRTEFEEQPSQAEARRKESTAEAEESEEPGYHDPPEWHDDHADGWEPCENLHDAFRSDTGWY